MQKFHQRRFARVLLAGIVAVLVAWQIASANDVALFLPDYPEQVQARKLTTTLLDSAAERAMVTYLPGSGLMVSLDLIRGPNSLDSKNPAEGTLDWIVFLLGELIGPELTEMPANESVTVAVDFYDYRFNAFRQIVVRAPIATYADGSSYLVWLDGQAYVTDVEVELAEGVVIPELDEEIFVVEDGEIVPFTDPGSEAQWLPISGEWTFADGVYLQTDEVNFDRISFFDRPVTGPYTYTINLQYRSGNMAGGLVFNAPDPQFRANAHMASFTNDGSFFQWGFFAGTSVLYPLVTGGRWPIWKVVRNQIRNLTNNLIRDI